MINFETLGLPAPLLESIDSIGFKTATPIQAEAIPHAIEGRDILGSAQTGTGKTAAYVLPIVANLMTSSDTKVLVLVPTRELASQVIKVFDQFINKTGLKTACIIGGESMIKQLHQLRKQPRIIVGTPGRVNDHLTRGSLDLKKCSYLVLDETDRMLDMGFGVQLDKIVGFMPQKRQTLMFSATMPKNINQLAQKYLNDPVRIQVGSATAPIENIKQEQLHTSYNEKYEHLRQQLGVREGSVVVFVKTKSSAEKMAARLREDNMTAEAIHGDLRQNRRMKVIHDFRKGKSRIMVATDVAARGLDIPHIEHVINYDLPQSPEDYVHRIGRTARAGANGSALNIITPEDKGRWRAINAFIEKGESNPEPFKKKGSPSPFKQKRSFKGKKFAGDGKFGNKKPGGKPGRFKAAPKRNRDA